MRYGGASVKKTGRPSSLHFAPRLNPREEMPTDADLALDEFISNLADVARRAEWSLVRFHESHTDRSFELLGNGRVSPFTAKVSLTEKAFWGLTEAKAEEMVASGREQLLLLTSAKGGYFLSATVLRRLMPKFSRTEENAVRINPNIIKGEARFADVEDAFELLEKRSVANAT